jgi:two-component system phosphate regulon response regulator PhoB
MSLFASAKKVLIVEDEPDIAENLAVRLKLEGYAVTVVHDGEAGVKTARELHPDLIIMDVMMPKLNGLDACKILRSEQKTKATPIIVLTALPHIDDAEKALEAGANDFLNKPYSNDRLMQKVHKFLPKKV